MEPYRIFCLSFALALMLGRGKGGPCIYRGRREEGGGNRAGLACWLALDGPAGQAPSLDTSDVVSEGAPVH
jgi:hypothetical protein